jgi:hypothetical protein
VIGFDRDDLGGSTSLAATQAHRAAPIPIGIISASSTALRVLEEALLVEESGDTIYEDGDVVILSVTLPASVAQLLIFEASRRATSPSAVLCELLEERHGQRNGAVPHAAH